MLSGCAAKYIVPSSGPLAKVTYRSTSSGKSGPLVTAVTDILVFETETCEGVSSMGKLKGSKEKPAEITIQVSAGKPLINTYRTASYKGYKYITSKFIPKEGKQYEVFVAPYSGVVISELKGKEKVIADSVSKPEKVCTF